MTDLDPLAGLPSLVSLLAGGLAGGTDRQLVQDETRLSAYLLADPVLLLRALRHASAGHLVSPLEDEIAEVLGPESIIEKLGTRPLSLMLSSPFPATKAPTEIFKLWLHSLAAAQAARSLCELEPFAGKITPDEAQVCSLLHDLSAWGEFSHRYVHGKPSHGGPLDWCKTWRISEKIRISWLTTQSASLKSEEHPLLCKLVLAAEMLAILAGFPHPAGYGKAEQDAIAELDDKELRNIEARLERCIRQQLAKLDIDIEVLRRAEKPDAGTNALWRGPELRPPVESGIVSLLGMGQDKRLQTLLTMLMKNCHEYINCDRAFFLQWLSGGKEILIRLKYDGTPDPIGTRRCIPSPVEIATIGKVAGSCNPMLLCREENYQYGLLDHLGSDRILIIPVAGGSMLHGFLIMDRAYSGQSEILEADTNKAIAIAGVWGQNLTSLMLKARDLRSQKDAYTDSLTGLMNRRAAITQLDREIQRLRRNKLPLTVLMMDLDRFKDWNDTYGHLTGDRILAKVGSVLKNTLRGSDIPARIGGEEFLIIQTETSTEEGSIVAARLYKAIEAAGQEMGIPITVSIGLTDLRPDDTMDSLLARVDKALYASKEYGRNRFSVDSL